MMSLNGSGGRREIGIPYCHEASHSRQYAGMSDSVKLPTVDRNNDPWNNIGIIGDEKALAEDRHKAQYGMAITAYRTY